MKDKIIVITGASSGIGWATAEAFSQEGAKLILCGRRKEKLIGKFVIKSLAFLLDLFKPDSQEIENFLIKLFQSSACRIFKLKIQLHR